MPETSWVRTNSPIAANIAVGGVITVTGDGTLVGKQSVSWALNGLHRNCTAGANVKCAINLFSGPYCDPQGGLTGNFSGIGTPLYAKLTGWPHINGALVTNLVVDTSTGRSSGSATFQLTPGQLATLSSDQRKVLAFVFGKITFCITNTPPSYAAN